MKTIAGYTLLGGYGMKNESGFMYPLSICMLLLFSFFLALVVESGAAERRIRHEAGTFAKGEYLMLSAVLKAEKQLEEGRLPAAGSFAFTDATADYAIRALSDSVVEVNFVLSMESEMQWIGTLHYDKELKRSIHWYE